MNAVPPPPPPLWNRANDGGSHRGEETGDGDVDVERNRAQRLKVPVNN